MIFLHEIHEIAGGRMSDFKAAHADWRRLVASRGNARALWLWEHTHGTGPSYQAVSVTAVAGWEAWGELVDRRGGDGDLAAWERDVAGIRRELSSKLLLPVAWSPMQAVDLGTSDLLPHHGSLYLHDTGWPYPGKLDGYIEVLGSVLYPQVQRSQMIAIEACWRVCPGTGRFSEVVLLQRVLNWEAFSRLLTSGERPSRAGDWMEKGLEYRDRWESKLLRPADGAPS